MRRYLTLSLVLATACYASCRQRGDIDQDPNADDSALIIDPELPPEEPKIDESKTNTADQTAAEKPAEPGKESPKEPPIIVPPQATQRIEALAFAHGNGMCLQLSAEGETSLQPCDEKAAGQKFLFSRSLDGRVQLKDVASARCLAVGPSSFFYNTLLIGEVCESKASQFFSVVDYGSTYSLKFDGNNTCIDAEGNNPAAGTRFILYRCSAVLNQKIQVVVKK